MHIFQHLEDRSCCDSMKYEFTLGYIVTFKPAWGSDTTDEILNIL